MKKWIVILVIVVVVLAGVCIYAFAERPIVPDGYVISNLDTVVITYNPSYPGDYSSDEQLSINADELLAILKTAKCRLSLGRDTPFFSEDMQYQFSVALSNGKNTRHATIYLGKDSWVQIGSFNYKILNAGDLMSALNVIKA